MKRSCTSQTCLTIPWATSIRALRTPSITEATVRLGRLAKEAGVKRFLFASSCSLYGAAQGWVDEESQVAPLTPYGHAKILAERDLLALASPDFSPVFLRNATVYGVSPRLRFDVAVNNLTAWAVARSCIRLKSDGTPWRPFVHVKDVAEAFRCALEAPREQVHAQAFNVGSTTANYRIRSVAQIIGEEVPGCAVTFADDASPDARSYRVLFDKANAVLGFTPQFSVRDGVRELYGALRDRDLGPGSFEGPAFARLAHLKALVTSGWLTPELRWTARGGRRASSSLSRVAATAA